MSLKHYLRMAYKEARLTSEADLSTVQHLDGILQSDHENLVLVYGGSFNPPHRGHLDVLLSGLRPEVAAIAIVILPSEDYHLRHKVANSHPDFFLQQKRRVDILSAISSILKDKLAFSHLIGPDKLSLRDPLAIFPYELPRLLVTNKARHVAAQFLPGGKPVIWDGFGDRSRCSPDYGNEYEGRESGQAEIVLWTCTGVGDSIPVKRGYYLQFTKAVSADIKSTDLRGALIQSHLLDEASLDKLSAKDLLVILAPILM
ncbi:hypothetical protein G7Y89_g14597 [Cudoniella acicularis]|uniref:Cytidyltransferase-like domain-containing protein n=1 Tax=Cudoniella acicularis TaxID=354080 RepID=A0A8H4R0M5_9HELO|nr:hypothetical protein G7Y89_g14597 [Cudoniella acicularis]